MDEEDSLETPKCWRIRRCQDYWKGEEQQWKQTYDEAIQEEPQGHQQGWGSKKQQLTHQDEEEENDWENQEKR